MAVYWPCEVHFQTSLSGSVVNTVCSISLQIFRYCPISWIPIIPWMSWAQLFACRPSLKCESGNQQLPSTWCYVTTL
jgi:hypothetical protein